MSTLNGIAENTSCTGLVCLIGSRFNAHLIRLPGTFPSQLSTPKLVFSAILLNFAWGSASVCYNWTTSKFSLASYKIWSLTYVLAHAMSNLLWVEIRKINQWWTQPFLIQPCPTSSEYLVSYPDPTQLMWGEGVCCLKSKCWLREGYKYFNHTTQSDVIKFIIHTDQFVILH